jgi:hypothetical protein
MCLQHAEMSRCSSTERPTVSKCLGPKQVRYGRNHGLPLMIRRRTAVTCRRECVSLHKSARNPGVCSFVHSSCVHSIHCPSLGLFFPSNTNKHVLKHDRKDEGLKYHECGRVQRPWKIESVHRPKPVIVDPTNVVKATMDGICGSELHTYRWNQDTECGHIMGHEFTGTIESVGSEIT